MQRSCALILMTLAAMAWSSPTPAAAPAAAVTVEALLDHMTRLDWLTQPPLPGERTVQFSSYDRASRLENNTLVNPFANGDRGHYLRVDTLPDGTKEHVLAEAEGPGFVSRIWSANPAGTLRIYIDGAARPALEADFTALTHGQVEPFTGPFGHESSRGCNLYFPFPFARSIKIVTTEGDQYFQVQLTYLPPETPVESYSPAILARSAPALEKARELLTNPSSKEEQLIQTAKASAHEDLAPGKHRVLVRSSAGSGMIESLAIHVASDDLEQGLARSLLTVTVDGASEPQVAVPLGDFFGSGPGINPFRSVASRVTADGGLASNWPMPWAKSIEIAVLNQSDTTLSLSRPAMQERELTAAEAADRLQFHARWHQEDAIQTVGGDGTKDWQALSAKGAPGRFVGLQLNVFNPTTAWWGEGDEKVYVDGEAFPSTFGTGTEDYFGYAWCDPTPYVNPFHAQTRCDGPGNRGNTSNVRYQILDQIPWQESLQFDLEVWHWKAVKVQYATIAYFYAAPGAQIEPAGITDLSGRIVHSSDIPIFREAGAIEAESLKVLEVTAGNVPNQEMSNYGEEWSGGAQLWWVCRQPEGTLNLELPAHEGGVFEITAAFTKAPDYGRVQLAIGDEPLGPPIDLYDRGVVHTGTLALGRVELEPSERLLTVKLAGKNQKSTSYLVGIDWIKLVPVKP